MSPRYINHVSPIVFDGPYSLLDTKLFLFPVKGDKQKIQASVDSFFEPILKDSHIKYQVMSSYLAIGVSYMNAVSANPEVQKIFGGFDETDYASWVPLLKTVRGVPVGIYWFMSFVLVDNPFAVATGREVFGFQKNQATFDPPNKPDGPVDFKASAWSLETYSPESRVKLRPIFELCKTNQAASSKHTIKELDPGHTSLLESMESDWDGLAKGFETAEVMVESLYKSLFLSEVPMVFLKQFRSATDTSEACCQSVVETMFKITEGPKISLITDQYQLTFGPNATYNLSEQYGLESGCLIDLSIEVDMSFDLPAGKIVYPK